jgi:hypothetical protein
MTEQPQQPQQPQKEHPCEDYGNSTPTHHMCLYCEDKEACEDRIANDAMIDQLTIFVEEIMDDEEDMNDETSPFDVNNPPFSNGTRPHTPAPADTPAPVEFPDSKGEALIIFRDAREECDGCESGSCCEACQTWMGEHDAQIREQALAEGARLERERVLDAMREMLWAYENNSMWKWEVEHMVESLRHPTTPGSSEARNGGDKE